MPAGSLRIVSCYLPFVFVKLEHINWLSVFNTHTNSPYTIEQEPRTLWYNSIERRISLWIFTSFVAAHLFQRNHLQLCWRETNNAPNSIKFSLNFLISWCKCYEKNRLHGNCSPFQRHFPPPATNKYTRVSKENSLIVNEISQLGWHTIKIFRLCTMLPVISGRGEKRENEKEKKKCIVLFLHLNGFNYWVSTSILSMFSFLIKQISMPIFSTFDVMI